MQLVWPARMMNGLGCSGTHTRLNTTSHAQLGTHAALPAGPTITLHPAELDVVTVLQDTWVTWYGDECWHLRVFDHPLGQQDIQEPGPS